MAEAKEQELIEIAKNSIPPYFTNRDKLALEIINHFCEITLPEIDTRYYLITLSSEVPSGATSSKPGNILLNWKKLLIEGSECLLTIIGTFAVPWLIPLAALVVWNKVWSMLTIELSERHAAVIWVLWNNRDEENCIEENNVLTLVNKELSKYNRPIMNNQELDKILEDLEKMECIEKIPKKNKLWLREWVKTSYK